MNRPRFTSLMSGDSLFYPHAWAVEPVKGHRFGQDLDPRQMVSSPAVRLEQHTLELLRPRRVHNL